MACRLLEPHKRHRGDFVDMAHTFKIEEDLDAAAIIRLKPLLENLAEGKDDLELDLAKVTFIDSSGVGAIVFLYKRLAGQGRRLWVRGLAGQPLQLFRHLALLTILSPAAPGGRRV
jgi:anti-anti-sigma factor